MTTETENKRGTEIRESLFTGESSTPLEDWRKHSPLQKSRKWLIFNLSTSRLGSASVMLGLPVILFPVQALFFYDFSDAFLFLLCGCMASTSGLVSFTCSSLIEKAWFYPRTLIFLGASMCSAALFIIGEWGFSIDASGWYLPLLACVAQLGIHIMAIQSEKLGVALLDPDEAARCNSYKNIMQTVGEIAGETLPAIAFILVRFERTWPWIIMSSLVLLSVIPTVFFTGKAEPKFPFANPHPDLEDRTYQPGAAAMLWARFFLWASPFVYLPYLLYMWMATAPGLDHEGFYVVLLTLAIALVLTVFGISSAYPGAWLAVHLSPRTICLGAAAAHVLHGGLFALGVAWAPTSLPMVWIAAAIQGVAWGFNLPAESHLLERCSRIPDRILVDYDTLSAVSNLAMFLAPLLGASILFFVPFYDVSIQNAFVCLFCTSACFGLLSFLCLLCLEEQPTTPPPSQSSPPSQHSPDGKGSPEVGHEASTEGMAADSLPTPTTTPTAVPQLTSDLEQSSER